METWHKPPLYTASHIGFGVLSFFMPVLIPIFIVYQLIQYFYNVRFFIRERQIRDKNSIAHTSVKFAEFILGLLIGYAIYTWKHS